MCFELDDFDEPSEILFEDDRPWEDLTNALKQDGFVVVQDVLDEPFVKHLYMMILQRLGNLLGTVALSGNNPFDLFSFTEIVHRSQHRYDIQFLNHEFEKCISMLDDFFKPIFEEYLGQDYERIRVGSKPNRK